ncbi:hypothetical protein HK105_201005 [Polyrhizophydium stewartii]|uniref:Serine/threonine-protein kinase 1 n=1 Tax=Polyrhizophydium stewartii TaxID=2732419 RepID=A0ABR4NIM5_9FUNG
MSRMPTVTKSSRRPTQELVELDEGYGSMPTMDGSSKDLGASATAAADAAAPNAHLQGVERVPSPSEHDKGGSARIAASVAVADDKPVSRSASIKGARRAGSASSATGSLAAVPGSGPNAPVLLTFVRNYARDAVPEEEEEQDDASARDNSQRSCDRSRSGSAVSSTNDQASARETANASHAAHADRIASIDGEASNAGVAAAGILAREASLASFATEYVSTGVTLGQLRKWAPVQNLCDAAAARGDELTEATSDSGSISERIIAPLNGQSKLVGIDGDEDNREPAVNMNPSSVAAPALSSSRTLAQAPSAINVKPRAEMHDGQPEEADLASWAVKKTVLMDDAEPSAGQEGRTSIVQDVVDGWEAYSRGLQFVGKPSQQRPSSSDSSLAETDALAGDLAVQARPALPIVAISAAGITSSIKPAAAYLASKPAAHSEIQRPTQTSSVARPVGSVAVDRPQPPLVSAASLPVLLKHKDSGPPQTMQTASPSSATQQAPSKPRSWFRTDVRPFFLKKLTIGKPAEIGASNGPASLTSGPSSTTITESTSPKSAGASATKQPAPPKPAATAAQSQKRSPTLINRLTPSNNNLASASSLSTIVEGKVSAASAVQQAQSASASALAAQLEAASIAAPKLSVSSAGKSGSLPFSDDDGVILDFASNKEKMRFESSYKLIKQIGSGGHSTVRLAMRESDGAMVVCKFIHASSVWHWHITSDPFPLTEAAIKDSQARAAAPLSPTGVNAEPLRSPQRAPPAPPKPASRPAGKTPLALQPSLSVDKASGKKAKPTSILPLPKKSAGKQMSIDDRNAASQASAVATQRAAAQRKIPLEIYMMRVFTESQLPGLVRYIEHFEIGSRFIIVMEYLGQDWIDLYDYIEIYGPVNEQHTREIFQQVVQTVAYMHSLGYCHNDIKDENIMINVNTREIKLIDFGSTTHLDPDTTTNIFYGTKKFAAPEALDNRPYFPEKQEVWALGTLLYVLLFKMDPFKSDEEVCGLDIERRIQRLRRPAPLSASISAQNVASGSKSAGHSAIPVSDEAVDLLVKLMEKKWENRPGIGGILGHRFFERGPDSANGRAKHTLADADSRVEVQM